MLDTIGLLMLVAGFVIGLGAVTVIDIHGFLGRASSYWTEATIRTHKVTKPLIWLGMCFAIVGGIIYLRNEPFNGIPRYLASIACGLILNGLFLSFHVSPYLVQREREGRAGELLPALFQKKIILSFIVSAVGWWGALVLVVWHITST